MNCEVERQTGDEGLATRSGMGGDGTWSRVEGSDDPASRGRRQVPTGGGNEVRDSRRACDSRLVRTAVGTWGSLVVAALFAEAVYRLGGRAWKSLQGGMTPGHWVALAALCVTLWYFEGYRSLQKRFVPQAVASAFGAASGGRCSMLLSPLYALSLLSAKRREVVRGWLLVAFIVSAVLAVRSLPEPWRGMVDAAVAGALSWGLGALLVELWRAIFRPSEENSK